MNHRPRGENPATLLEHDFAQERASALGRLGRALEAALAALGEFDDSHPRDEANRAVHKKMVMEASTALWQFVVQREACGMRDMRAVIRDYRVPAEVAAHMGAMPEQPARRRR